ncbi:hypothetical protein SH1V18_41070 [Vallitalea longa]|uniref:Uncharacterized protein n=1 Tax=Vallitalea longa TaxID=2936439 RepID=A0A9W5YCU2_9FIRM|nr:lanthionine synthetase C family protein [Vallitalea longa]GKX31627.1 hypothetical protein SH1V18_41070 [Vallitalea longa]
MEWSQVIDERIRSEVLKVVNDGVQRLVNAEQIKKKMLESIETRKKKGLDYMPWSATDLARGYSGLCVMFGALDRIEPEKGWDKIGYSYLQEIQKEIMKEGIKGFGLWTGLAGVIIAARALSRGGERYENFIGELNSVFLRSFPSMMEFIQSKSDEGVSLDDFDVIQGMSGIGRYTLCFRKELEMRNALEQILLYLVKLCEYKKINGIMVPGWFVSYDKYRGYGRKEYPNGHFNCGMSHGIVGVLALMSIAMINKVEVTGQREAIHKIVDWMMRWKTSDKFGPIWPARVSWEENIEGRSKNTAVREAWCYGSPGVARALWLSGMAVNNEEWKEVALDTFRGTALRPMDKWNIESDTFCHGYAGLLQMVQRMYSESGDELLGDLRNNLAERVIELWKPNELYGYQEGEKSDKQDIAGLLDGVAGVFTVLIGLIEEQESDWDLVFLIR